MRNRKKMLFSKNRERVTNTGKHTKTGKLNFQFKKMSKMVMNIYKKM